MPAPEFRMAIVADVSVALPSQFPTVVLRETEAPRRQLSFAVGMQDGVGLSHALRRVPTPRPLTHELVSDVLSGFDIDVVAVRLVGRQGQTYFAELDLRGRTGRNVHSCRPTDALAIALRQAVPVPILIDSRLFEESGNVVPWSPPPPVPEAQDDQASDGEPEAASADERGPVVGQPEPVAEPVSPVAGQPEPLAGQPEPDAGQVSPVAKEASGVTQGATPVTQGAEEPVRP